MLRSRNDVDIEALHSNLVIFKYAHKWNCCSVKSSLHSNLVIFKFKKAVNVTLGSAFAFTFQSGYIQMRFPVLPSEYKVHFTFQSGYIQMPSQCHTSSSYRISFTFQSGYIQIRSNSKCNYAPFTLHSNLVIFKSPIVIYK